MDKLEVRCALDLHPEARGKLEEVRRKMYGGDDRVVSIAAVACKIERDPLLNGVERYSLVLRSPALGCVVGIGLAWRPGEPARVFVRFDNEALWTRGLPQARWSEVRTWLERLGLIRSAEIVRLDLAADFIDLPLRAQDRTRFVGRIARGIDAASDERTRAFSGFHPFPRRGQLRVRIYDKTLELTASEKHYMPRIWGARAEGKQVWRVEFSFNTEGLRRRRFLHSADPGIVLDMLEHLWHYAAGGDGHVGVLRLIGRRRGKNGSRWTTSPVWRAIQNAWPKGARAARKVPVPPRIPQPYKRVGVIGGHMQRFAVETGSTGDFYADLRALVEPLLRWFGGPEGYRDGITRLEADARALVAPIGPAPGRARVIRVKDGHQWAQERFVI